MPEEACLTARQGALGSGSEEARLAGRPLIEPQELLCPIMHAMFRDPVIVPEAGRTFEREGIEGFWRKSGRLVDPLSNRALKRRELYTNWDKRGEVQRFLELHPGYVPEGWDDRQVPNAMQDMEAGEACCGGALDPGAPQALPEPTAVAVRHISCPLCLERRPIFRRLLLLLVCVLLLSQTLLLLRLQLEHLA
mmetsp:Transcript_117522/g.327321  ORF Transcript_117522/g.327321 Transcript_117522/m.327321 type:complete len:193 (-) Transcript_117522:69-647(-)